MQSHREQTEVLFSPHTPPMERMPFAIGGYDELHFEHSKFIMPKEFSDIVGSLWSSEE